MAKEQATTTVPLPVRRYVARHTISVSDCRTKFNGKKVVLSNTFYSDYDPLQTLFRLKLCFGQDESGYMSAFVVTELVKITITKMKFNVFDGKGVRLCGHSSTEQRIVEAEKDWGYSQLLKSEVVKDTVNVSFEMEYERFSSSSEPAYSPQKSLLQDDLTKLFESGSHADCAFIVQGEKIMAHKGVITARCSHFESAFRSNMKESITGEIEVPDFTPHIFKELLKYLYSGRRPECSEEDLMGLLAAADKYRVDELKIMCESALTSRLGSENVIEILLLADRLNCPVLMERATVVFKMYMGDLKKEERWFKLKTNPDLLLKLFDSCCMP